MTVDRPLPRLRDQRDLVIAGVPRSGKSGLSRIFARMQSYSHFPADSIVSSLADVYPELGIGRGEDHETICRRFRPFLEQMVNHQSYEQIRFVLDIYHLLPDDAAEIFPKERFVVTFLGYPRADVARKFKEIRKFESPRCWTAALDDRELKRLIERYIEESRSLEQGCAALNLAFIDVSDGSRDWYSSALIDLITKSCARNAPGD